MYLYPVEALPDAPHAALRKDVGSTITWATTVIRYYSVIYFIYHYIKRRTHHLANYKIVFVSIVVRRVSSPRRNNNDVVVRTSSQRVSRVRGITQSWIDLTPIIRSELFECRTVRYYTRTRGTMLRVHALRKYLRIFDP